MTATLTKPARSNSSVGKHKPTSPVGRHKPAASAGKQKLASAVDKNRLTDLSGQIAAISKSQAVIEFNLDGTVLTANENFLRTLG